MTVKRLVALASTLLLLIPGLRLPVAAQEPAAPSGTIGGRVVDEDGTGIAGAQVYIERPALGTQTRSNGEYVLSRVPAGDPVVIFRGLGVPPGPCSIPGF